ncbi:hypothetical protein [Nonomuraea sp. SYSU D8015]|uniref:hypothetical protein n=1 Tax=Nonomuraea sp. SYSU D8015 TaxID=2593644 RepID=UPI00166091D9|nr:hypothetical protein [Nonomuraea sp. SYSU D8015]
MMILEDVPFDSKGNMVRDTSWIQGITRRTVTPFLATLMYAGYDRRTSSFSILWEDRNGHKFPMFWSDFDKMLPDIYLGKGVVVGWWRVVKRSGYFGIQRIPDDEVPK